MKFVFGILIFIFLGTRVTDVDAQTCTIAKCDTLVDTALYVLQSKILIDGKLDEKNWRLMSKVKNTNPYIPYSGSINPVTFGTLWNEKYLYVGVKVIDALLFHQSGYTGSLYYPQHLDDAVELFINPNNSHTSGRALQIVQAYNEPKLYPANATNSGMIVKQAIIEGGYSVEFAIPWDYLFPPQDNLGIAEKINIGKHIGFDVAVDDDNLGKGERQYQLVWNNKCDNDNYLTPLKYGFIVLSGAEVGDIIANQNSISGQVFLCTPGTANYTITPRQGYMYTWQAIGGNILSQSGTSATINWDQRGVDTLKLLIKNTCGPLRPNSLPVKVGGPKLTITGSNTVCPAVTGIDYWLTDTLQNTNFQWFVKGGTIAGVSSPISIKVNWGDPNTSAMVKCLGKDQGGCYGDTAILNVNVNEKLKPQTPAGDEVLCFLDRVGKAYSVINSNGSDYNWQAENGIIKSGQGTSQITVDWGRSDIIAKLSVYEKVTTALASCKGGSDTITVKLISYDSLAIDLIYITLKEEDETKADVKWQVVTNSSDTVVLTFGNGGLQRKIKIEKSITTYTFNGLSPGDSIYSVSINGQDHCGYGIESKLQNTLRLKGEIVPSQKLARLSWNAYNNWPSGVKNYEVWRKFDDKQFIKASEVLEPFVDVPYSNEALKHTYRIKAVSSSNDNIVSFSNMVVLNIEITVSGANVITPNGDEINEYFVFENLSVYPQKELMVYNRWGAEVFHSGNYENNWNAPNLNDGVYFYHLKYGSIAKDKNYKGWIQVIR
jgi:gliding motility-associated-like protein